MANTESVAALLKDPRKKMKKKVTKTTGIANAIQRRIANGSYGKGKGQTSGTGFKPGPTVGAAQAQRTPISGSVNLAKLGSQGNQSARYASKTATQQSTGVDAMKRALTKKKFRR